jgi:hypothetical protein
VNAKQPPRKARMPPPLQPVPVELLSQNGREAKARSGEGMPKAQVEDEPAEPQIPRSSSLLEDEIMQEIPQEAPKLSRESPKAAP